MIREVSDNRQIGLSRAVFHGVEDSARVLGRSRRLPFFTIPVVMLIFGCGAFRLNPDPELAPTTNIARVWSPPTTLKIANEAFSRTEELHSSPQGWALQTQGTQAYDLPALVDLALRTNPQTRRQWYAAQAADAQLGQKQADNFPKISADVEGGYLKLPIQFPGQTLVIRNEAFLPQIKVSYDLLDFGRTRAAERGAREQLIAANFAFNRAIQDVVFNVEKAYYVLSAAKSSVGAAEANLRLARASLAAVQERHQMGLATKPQILLANQVEAQAVYDLENTKSMVHDAESGLAEAIGVTSNVPITVQSIDHEKIAASLGSDVEQLIDSAFKDRPDIAAQIAAVRAGDASIARAASEFYPEVEVSGNYGQIIWSYTVNGGHTQNLDQPAYGALLTLRWNLFTGFNRYYGERKARAERDAARSELKSLQLDVITSVRTAYYDFLSAQKKYDASVTLVAASQESLNANMESHRQGLATITDLIGAERDLMAARYTLVQNKADLLISSSALAHAVGTEFASATPSH